MYRANLPWYDLDEVRTSTDVFWSGLARHLRAAGFDVSDRLAEDDYESFWRSPDMLLSQCCGYDAVLPLKRTVRVVATPCYRAPGCVGPTYSSFVMVRGESPYGSIEDLRGARAVINNPTSHSGTNGLRALVAPLHRGGRFFSAVRVSGCHLRSLEMVRDGSADVAAIDCVVVELLRQNAPGALDGLRIIARTALTAAPPYVTRFDGPVERLQEALAAAMEDPALAEAREALLLGGMTFLPLEAYRPMVEMARRARRLGYMEMEPLMEMSA